MNITKKKLFRTTAIAVALTSALIANTASAAPNLANFEDGASSSTQGMKGWAPYLPSVGAKYIGVSKADRKDGPQVGDIIEVPTYLLANQYSDFYAFADGNFKFDPGSYLTGKNHLTGDPITQDGDVDNRTRVRPDQYLNQKVTIKWYAVDLPSGSTKVFADLDEITGDAPADLATNPEKYVTSWEDVVATPLADLAQTIRAGSKSVSLTVPPEAIGKRVGFIIVAESQTGDPFRGQPLKVPDLNYFWKQNPPKGPGEVCLVPVDPANPEDCEEVPEVTPPLVEPEPEDKNPEGPGGEVGLGDYIITIRHLEGTTFADADPLVDPAVGSAAHPYPLVNETYYAEIKILTPDGKAKVDAGETLSLSDYRQLEGAELETLTWNLSAPVLKNDGTPEQIGTDAISGDPIFRTNDLSITWDGTGDERISDNGYVFKTQVNNAEAENYWGTAVVNGFQEESEQRMSLTVSFKYDPEYDNTP